jgi:tetratricopeptide (TPR) repeat protein/transglutaminase-like putative cysteine protease
MADFKMSPYIHNRHLTEGLAVGADISNAPEVPVSGKSIGLEERDRRDRPESRSEFHFYFHDGAIRGDRKGLEDEIAEHELRGGSGSSSFPMEYLIAIPTHWLGSDPEACGLRRFRAHCRNKHDKKNFKEHQGEPVDCCETLSPPELRMSTSERSLGPSRVFFLLLSIFSFPITLVAQQPWDARTLAGSPQDIVAAARAAAGPVGDDVVVLLDDIQIVMDSAGRAVETAHTVYRIGTSPPEDWAIVGAIWQPWRQQRPSVRARVVTADGREVQLDEKALAELPLPAASPDIFPDGRILRAPLPAISAGSIVEVQTTIRDTQPLLASGIVRYIPLGRLVPSLRTILTVEVPSTVPLKHVVRLLPNAVVSNTTSGAATILRIENPRIEPLDPTDFLLPSAEHTRPYVAFSTAASWRDVASGYATLVNPRIAASNVAGLVREVIGTSTDRREIIDKLLQRVQRNIRYAAVELGSGSIIPRSPDETTRVEYGDCKDQAALLIAMLRAAGIESYMALLSTGSGPDIEPGLPGFGAFDHVIVYIPGTEPIWIDSTTRFSRAGQLPVEDQGRLALVVRPDTTELIRTPELTSRTLEILDVTLPEEGRGRFIATREFFGSTELSLRAVQSQVKPAEMEEALAAMFSARSVAKLERSDATDLSSPFKLRFEVVESALSQTSGGEAVFFLPVNSLEESGLAFVKELEDETAASGLDLGEVSVHEWRYRITPPPGYRRLTLPENSKIALGPATLTRTFSEGFDGTLSGAILLDTGKRRYTPQDIAALKAAAEKLGDEAFIRITFEQTAQALLDEGKTREALKEFRALSEMHSKEAIHRSQLAKALLQAGLGEHARSEARKAIELEPGSEDAYAVLGWVLEHDLIGRRWKSGFELDQAKEAFQKALEIAPDDITIRSDYAILLEYNRKGERYAADVDLGPSIEQYRKIHDKLEDKSPLRRNLPFNLFWMKRYSEVRSASNPPDFRLAAIAATDGVAAALREAGRLDSADRASAVDGAVSLLLQSRLYEQAATLSRSGANGANAQRMMTRADQIERMKRFEDLLTDKKSPATVAKEFLARALLGDRGEKLIPMLSKEGQRQLRDNPELKPAIASMPIAVLAGIGAGLAPRLTAADSAISTLSVAADGNDASGYRIDFGIPLAGGAVSSSRYLYVVLEEGEYRVLTAARSDFALAQGALRFLERNDVAAARQWLDWAEDESDLSKIDAAALNTEAFFGVWFNSPTKDRARMRFAAATLLSTSPAAAETVLPILQEGRNSTTGLVRHALNLAYGTALLTLGRTAESLAIGQQLLKETPSSRAIFLVAECMLRLDRAQTLVGILQEALKKGTDIREVTLLLASLELKQGKFTEAEARLKTLAESGRDRADDRRVLAWLNLYREQISPAMVTEAQQSTSSRSLFNSGWMRLLAALYAETGKTKESLAMLAQSLDSAAKGEPDPDDWFIIGRVYEQYGEIAAAQAAYQQVIARKEPLPGLESAALLAQRRLEALKAVR